jgi:hypothetical protein
MTDGETEDEPLLPPPIDPVDTTEIEGKKPPPKKREKIKRDLVKEADLAVEKADKKEALKKKRRSNRNKILAGVVVVLGLILYVGLQPLVGTPRYGVCRTFIELQLPYPETLQINVVEESALAVRVYFSHIDAFGSSRLNMIECEYKTDQRLGLVLSSVYVNRVQMPKETVEMFNYTVPYVLANPPDLRLPRFRSDSLSDLKIDYY